MVERLTGKTAVVTGASRGIGLAIARALHANGAQVAMIARHDAALGAAARTLGFGAVPVTCDVTDANAVAQAVERIVAGFSATPDILVNNAGAFRLASIDQVDPSAFAADLDTNLVAPFRLIHAFLAGMKARRGGHVITIGSSADRSILPGNASYAPGKFGARALHEALRQETRGSGVRATLISPAQVDTALWDTIDPGVRDATVPRSEMLRAEAVANAVLYAVTQPLDVNVDELRLSRS